MMQTSPSTPLWIAARRLLAQQGGELFSRWSKVVRSFGVEEIHDLRVASRRLREGLALFHPLFPEQELDQIGRKVKKLTRILGSLRNVDEALVFFSELTPEEMEETTRVELLATLGRERESTLKSLKRGLRSIKPSPLRSFFRATRNQPRLFGGQGPDPFQSLIEFAREAIEVRSQPVQELLPLALQEYNSAKQHELRIAVKKLRYRLEILSPLFGPEYQELHQGLKKHQDLLGKLHDLTVFAEMAAERIPDEEVRLKLLKVIAGRREELFASFVAELEGFPLASVGNKARESL